MRLAISCNASGVSRPESCEGDKGKTLVAILLDELRDRRVICNADPWDLKQFAGIDIVSAAIAVHRAGP
jgi:hypothetical protein